MADSGGRILFELGSDGQRLRVRLVSPYSPNAADLPARSLAEAAIDVEAVPFVGTVKAILTVEDLEAWSEAMRRFATNGGRCHLGGGREAEIILERLAALSPLTRWAAACELREAAEA